MLQTPKHITAIIESHLDQMTRLEKQIASYFTQLDPSSADLSQENTIQQLHISPSALTRFAKNVDFPVIENLSLPFRITKNTWINILKNYSGA